MNFSDFVENVIETPICCKLKQLLDKLYEFYNKEERTGRWIEHRYGMSYIECSKCSFWFLRMHLRRSNYCPNCGAKMVWPQEGSDKE